MEVVVRSNPAENTSPSFSSTNFEVLNLDQDADRGADVRCLLTELRNERTDCPAYRRNLTQFYESYIFPEFLKTLRKKDVEIMTAMKANYLGKMYERSHIIALEIPRAGTLPTDLLIDRIQKLPGPDSNINIAKAVIDIKRKEEGKSLSHVVNYSNLPEMGEAFRVAICDQMLATGKTTAKAISILHDRYEKKIQNLFIGTVVGVPQGIQVIENTIRSLGIKTKLVVGAIDDGLDEKSYILPGLGDAGDRVSGVWRPNVLAPRFSFSSITLRGAVFEKQKLCTNG